MSVWEMVNGAMRALAFLWALLIMALTGNMINQWNYGPAVINYSLFVSIIGMLTLFYLLPASFMPKLAFHPAIPLALDVLNLIFWFCGAVALAAELHVHSCTNEDYLNSNSITYGSEKRCREAQATTAFLWFGFASFLVSTIVSAMGLRGGAPSRGVRRGPAMSQV